MSSPRVTSILAATVVSMMLQGAAAGAWQEGETMTESRYEGLRTAIFVVPDIEAAKNWYSEVLGKGPYFDEPFYVGFDVGGFELGLLPEEDGYSAGAGGTQVYWGVPDARAEYQRLLGLGATKHTAPQDVGSDIVTASVLDPWGNVFGVIRNPHFGN